MEKTLKSDFEKGLDKGRAIFDALLPFRVFEDFQVEQFGEGLSPMYELAGAFKTKELAADFVEYQATINPKIKYDIREEKKLL